MIADIFDFNREIYFDGRSKYWQIHEKHDKFHQLLRRNNVEMKMFSIYNPKAKSQEYEIFKLEDFDNLVLSGELKLVGDDMKAKLLLEE